MERESIIEKTYAINVKPNLDDRQIESLISTHYHNSKAALDFSKIDMNYLKKVGISLHTYLQNALKDYIDSKFILAEYTNGNVYL